MASTLISEPVSTTWTVRVLLLTWMKIIMTRITTTRITTTRITTITNHDDHEGEVEIDQFDLNFKTTSFALGLTKAFDNDVSLSLGLSSIERAPSALEMFINGPHLAAKRFEIGDPTMSSERGFNSEISLSIDRPNFFLNLTLFNNEVSDYIYLRDETEEEHEEEEHEEHDHGS